MLRRQRLNEWERTAFESYLAQIYGNFRSLHTALITVAAFNARVKEFQWRTRRDTTKIRSLGADATLLIDLCS